jgi:hypothetical protein
MGPLQIAEAFSGHRFAETYDELAASVRWGAAGSSLDRGKGRGRRSLQLLGRRDGPTQQR